AGIQSNRTPVLNCISKDRCSFVQFNGKDISYRIVGMSDVMPYRSKRFCDLTSGELSEYENSFAKKIKDAVREFKPDIIHSHHLWLLSALTRRLCPDLPIVTTCHGSDLRQFQQCTHLQNKVLRGCRKVDAVMALSEAQKNEIERLYRLPSRKIHVVGAGYNDALFSEDTKPEPNPVHLAYAGKLSNAKGVPWLLRALSKIDYPAWHLHLVGSGSGSEKENCLRLAQNLGRRVQLLGAVDQQELAQILKQSHIFILPSFYEGLPLVVLEALACGCRIVANDLPGIVEIFRDMQTDDISLVKTPRLHSIDTPFPEDEKTFEEKLEHAIRKQLSAAAKQPQIDLSGIKEKITAFSWANVFKKVESVYLQTQKSFESAP
ncbi:MAG: glycosyltransferase family 4 protein, partial [Desulfobacterales bacterium]